MRTKKILNLTLPRWHQDSDGWVWRVYDAKSATSSEAVTSDGEDTSDLYIIQRKDGWYLINAATITEEDKEHWVKRVQEGEGVPVAGPFAELNSAKAAWRLMWG